MAVGLADTPAERPPVERIVWRVRKGAHLGEARLRDVPGYGRELRFIVAGELVASFMARDRRVLDEVAREKLAGFRARDWQPVPVHCSD